jgi:acetyl-CoA synthetase
VLKDAVDQHNNDQYYDVIYIMIYTMFAVHRIGTAEVESALVAHALVSEAAVVGFPEAIKGQALCCYISLVANAIESDALLHELKQQVSNHIGRFASPDVLVITPGLPKTRSGKIMR